MGNIIKRFLGWFGSGIGYTGGNYYQTRNYLGTAAGPAITEDTALTIPAFFHALRLYGQTIGSLPWDLIQVDDAGRRTIARNHPVHRLLHDEPNEFQLPSSFRETLIAHAICYGNGYAFIERNGNFRPTALLPLLPDRTYPTRVAGQLKFITIVNGVEQTLEPYEVIHVPGFSMNGITGVPLVKIMRESLGLTKAEESYASAYFGNGGNYGGVVTVPGRLDDAAMKNLRDGFQQNNSGLGNAFRWIFLEEGMKAERSDVDAEKTQLIQSRAFQLSELSRITGLAPHLLFDLSRSTNNNIEFQGIEAVTYSFGPWANKLNQESARKLLYESEKGVFEPVIDLKRLQQGSAKEQAEKDQIRFNTSSITPNEIRAKDGLNPIEGGDQLFVNVATMPLNLVIQKALQDIETAKAAAIATITDPALKTQEDKAVAEGVDKQPAEPNDNPPPAGNKLYDDGPAGDPQLEENVNMIGTPPPARSLRPVISAAAERIMRRELKAVQSGLQKTAGDQAATVRWLAAHVTDSTRQAKADLSPIAATMEDIGQPVDVDAVIKSFSEDTQAEVKAILDASPLDRPELIQQMQTKMGKERTEKIINQIMGDKCEPSKPEQS